MLFNKPISDLNIDDISTFCKTFDENIRVEYKANLNSVRNNLVKVLSSFANSYGGVLIIGVKSEGGKVIFPIRGFNKPSHEEPRVTIQQRCLDQINNPILPEIKVINITEKRIVILVYVNESHEAPHSIENNKSVYIRTGDFSRPYDRADIDRIEYLFKRRYDAKEKSKLLLSQSIKRLNFFRPQQLPAGTYPEIILIIHPTFVYHPIIKNTDIDNFMRGRIRIPKIIENLFLTQNLRRLLDSEISIFSDSKNHFYTELNQWGYLLHSERIRADTGINFMIDNQDKTLLNFAHIVISIAKYITLIKEVYNYSNFYGSCDFELHLQSLYHEGLLYRFDIPSDLDFIFQEKNAKSKIQAYSSKINIELKDIITDLLHPIVWAFKQSHDSIQRDNVLHNVEDLLKRNRFIE